MKKKIVLIVGPTASGKTGVSIALAKALRGEIISADSMQVYQKLNIGTAKITKEEMEGIPHHLLDFVDPAEDFSVARFRELAYETIEEILKRGNLPIVVGGTGLYITSLTEPMDYSDGGVDPSFREEMRKLSEEKGPDFLHDRLKEIDPDAAEKIHPNNVKRVIRALEVYHLTNRKISEVQRESKNQNVPYDPILIGLTLDRQKLYDRINVRVDSMMKKGLLEEVKSLTEQGYGEKLLSMQALGYKEFLPYLNGQGSLEDAVEILKRDTRHFAKRQMTWFKRDKRIFWVDREQFQTEEEMLELIISHVKGELYDKAN